ncbi:LOW QUALITY PROTEIN: Integrase catalytic core protein [Phytophthora palmivora]|uniref:Integrase catalytic core protein n=1 Tax=Phytophthora palmivora TaxID=4796 RepID=A0A2P4YVU1_9STRA|nr:LOW QUALITY PROTEIN: Integrase catalytic core protein [Phytophthora palmivora]
MRLPEAHHWDAAARSESKSLMDNKTWILTALPNGLKALFCRWVFVVKYNGDGTIDRYKARLVIKVFNKNMELTTMRYFLRSSAFLRLLLTIAALLELVIHQIDVKTAFLNEYLDEEMYMEQPDGFTVRGKEHLVCKLLKRLYVSKREPSIWYLPLFAFLKTMKFCKLI